MSVNPLLQVQKVTLPSDSLRFITPCSISVAGPSQSEIKENMRFYEMDLLLSFLFRPLTSPQTPLRNNGT